MNETALLNKKLDLFENMCEMAREMDWDLNGDSSEKYIEYIERKEKLIAQAREIDAELEITRRDLNNRLLAAKISEKAREILLYDSQLKDRATDMLEKIKLNIRRTKNFGKLNREYYKNVFAYMDGGRDLAR